MNPRKILVQAELAVRFLAFSEGESRYTIGVEGGETPIQTKMERVSFQYISQVAEKTFPFEENVSLSSGHRKLERLLSCDLTPYCNESKIVGSKVVFKGGVKARVRALLRRANIEASRKLSVDGLLLYADALTASLAGAEIPVTIREFNILYELLSCPNRIFPLRVQAEVLWQRQTH